MISASRRMAILVAFSTGLVAIAMWISPDSDPPPTSKAAASTSLDVSRSTLPETIEIESDAPRFGTLEQLVEGSQLIVSGQVSDITNGPPLGSFDVGTLTTRLVVLEVAIVLKGDTSIRNVFVTEVDGLEDGSNLNIDGVSPTPADGSGIWFLTNVNEDPPVFLTVGPQGRWLQSEGRLVGPQHPDKLSDELARMSVSELATAVAALR